MGLFDNIKVRQAIAKHQRGDVAGAKADYEALIAGGTLKPSFVLPYSVLLLREGGEENFKQVKALLAKIQKSPEMNPELRSQLLMNYAIADWKLGNGDKAISLLEASHRERPCGITFQTLGFLYVDAGDAEKALKYNEEAREYDDEDAVILDNLGQIHYRLLNDKAKARPYFEKAHELRPAQIDTLWFLAQYNLDEGKTKEAIEKLEKALEGRFSPLNHVSREDVEAKLRSLQPDAE